MLNFKVSKKQLCWHNAVAAGLSVAGRASAEIAAGLGKNVGLQVGAYK